MARRVFRPTGRILATPDPGLKPWAVLYSRFAAKSDSPYGTTLQPYRLNFFRNAWVARREISTSSPPLRVSFSV